MNYPPDRNKIHDLFFASESHESLEWAGGESSFTERHLQCVWYDGKWRPDDLISESGETITVLNPGTWNSEAGPDFINAEITVGESGRRIRGDVEVHIRPADWTSHHHGGDPRYANVILHVTYFPESSGYNGLPPQIIRLPLRASLAANKSFSFDDIDITAYPHGIIPDSQRPCGIAASRMNPDCWKQLLLAAGRHRLRVKADRIAMRIKASGDKYQVFYEETMALLGAKRNSGAFRRTAERLPLSAVRNNGDAISNYAALLGTAGLIPMPENTNDEEARAFASLLWKLWFKSGGGAADANGLEWSLNGIRPLNHPLRRMAAAAALFTEPEKILDTISFLNLSDPGKWMKDAVKAVTDFARIPFWIHRQSFDSAPEKAEYALLGPSRAAVIVTNLVLPFIMTEKPEISAIAEFLPPEDIGNAARETAYRLFGRDHNPAFYANSGLMIQGLLAIHREFCLDAKDGCDTCPLARHLEKIPT